MKSQTDHLDSALPKGGPPPRPWRWLPVCRLSESHRQRNCVLDHLLALDDQDRHLRLGHVASDDPLRQYAGHLLFRPRRGLRRLR